MSRYCECCQKPTYVCDCLGPQLDLVTLKDFYGRRVRVDRNELLTRPGKMVRLYNQYGLRLSDAANHRRPSTVIHRENLSSPIKRKNICQVEA